MELSRRTLIGTGLMAGAATGLAGCVSKPGFMGEPALPAWTAGFRNAPAAGFDPAPMRLVSGKVPAGLKGTFYRNGPAQFSYGDEISQHWFDGDGMVQAIRIEDGEAIHTGRFVQTPKRADEQEAGRFLAPGFGTVGDPDYPVTSPDSVNAANTSVVMAGGELLALWEAGSPWRMDPVTLESRGAKTWRNDLKAMPFLAHPKQEPDGRLWNLAMNGTKVGIYRIGTDGEIEDFGMVDIGVPAYVHDWAMTDKKLIILVQPWIYTRNTPPFVEGLEWRPEDGLKFLIIDKDDFTNTRWSQAPARAFFHTGAAWEESDGTIRFDASLYAEPVLGKSGEFNLIKGEFVPERDVLVQNHTMIVIPPTGDARLEETGLRGEFPQTDPRRHGTQRRYTALVGGPETPGRYGPSTLMLHDWLSGSTAKFNYGPDRIIEEHLYVPKPGSSAERDAWLIGPTLNVKTQATEIHVFDVADVSAGPVASWSADYSWPLGFHGTWAAA